MSGGAVVITTPRPHTTTTPITVDGTRTTRHPLPRGRGVTATFVCWLPA